MDQPNQNMRQRRWLDMVMDFDCDILYHSRKENVAVDSLSNKSDSYSVGSLCMNISIDSPLLDLIREAQVEGVKKENWKQERISGEIDRFSTDSHGLLIRYGRVWVPDFGGSKQTVLEEARKSRFSIHPGATKMYRDLRLSY
ncbi:uncharacterized protein LOC111879681 [Lactuca sativa]|uniref:uncharacterized protein LOC111879681 n=1 Tax=Lactuca sativa TaxID=4236 RepID=UPI000CD862CA|nr:uncharacterized protein LOC111879681 [Lactuca sativa]